jgi:hypothetical protein
MTLDARESALDNFRREGEILLATTASMTEGVNLAETSDLVFFYVPRRLIPLTQGDL